MRLNIQFHELNPRFIVTFNENSQNLGTIFKEVQTITEYIGGKVYEGDYVIIPKVSEQQADTAGKIMIENIIIRAIPYFDVSNTSGGSTVYIGSEV